MAKAASSGEGGSKGFLGYTVGSGNIDSPGIEFMSNTPEILDMIRYGGGAANNNVGFSNYIHHEDLASPKKEGQYGKPLEQVLGSGYHGGEVSNDFRAGMNYAISAILGAYDQPANNNENFLPTVRGESRPSVLDNYGVGMSGSSAPSSSYDSIARPISPSRPRMPQGKGRVIEFSDVQVFRKTTLRIWER
jgi:hypothetical protein